ncbi:NAD(P)/FAD-dependent oxidoreductase [Mycoavidus cysteinexigens]|nr:NAD(P)-binding protein [Mycoavidus cysteinexigens]
MSAAAAVTGQATHIVAVVGAGLAGLACAQVLAQAGCIVHVFDKSRGPSGRMSTRRADDAQVTWQCDHGAQYFTARDADFRAEVQRWQQAGAAALWPARLASHDGQGFAPLHTPLERFVGTPRMTAPAAHLVRTLGALPPPLVPVQVRLQTTVQALETSASGWSLTSAEHASHATRYRAVLLAVPAPQAVPLLTPVAPDGAALAASALMRGCWAVMVRCIAPVSLPCDGVFINSGPLRWLARDSNKPGRTGPETWLLHASPEWSEAHIEDDAASVTTALLRAFAALGGPDPATVHATAHRWRYADTEPPLTAGCWWNASLGLGLCGDWLHGGKVEGAWLSGRALARCVLDTLAP